MSYPSNWRICKLPEVVYFQEGTGLRKFQYRTSGIPFLNIRTLVNERVNRNLCQYISTEEVEQKYKHFLLNEGDIICSTSGTLGKTAVIHAEDLPLLLNTSVMRFRSLNEEIITQKYIHLYLKSDFFINQAINASTGSAQVNVGPTHMKTFDIPVPPLNEQKHITEKLDSLLTRVDSCQTHLERVPQILKRFRQSVLAAAIEGRLLEDDIPTGNGELPNGWRWAKAEEVCHFITKGTTPKSNKLFAGSGDIPFIKVYNLTFDGSLDFLTNPTFVGKETHKGELARSIAFPNDVLMNIVGPPLGKISIVPNTYPEWNMNQAIARFRPLAECDSKYLSFVLMSNATLQWATRRAKATAGQFNLTLEICRELPIPLPPLSVQKEIVRRVEKLFVYAERLEACYTSASEHVERLTPSLLAKAFRGELVGQEQG